MLPITIIYHHTVCYSFFSNAITISTVSDFVCDNKRARCLSLSYTNACTPTSYCDYNFVEGQPPQREREREAWQQPQEDT